MYSQIVRLYTANGATCTQTVRAFENGFYFACQVSLVRLQSFFTGQCLVFCVGQKTNLTIFAEVKRVIGEIEGYVHSFLQNLDFHEPLYYTTFHPLGYSYPFLFSCLTFSKSIRAVATLTFREATSLFMGMFTNRSHSFCRGSEMPSASPPIKKATGPRSFVS